MEPVQRLKHECRVAHPCIAVVPVALSARSLWEGGGERRNSRSRWHSGETFDSQRRALNLHAVAMVGNAGPSEPGAPEADRGGNSRLCLVDVVGCVKPFRPRESTICLLALSQDVARPNAVALDPQRE